jgi:hypothetical protein
MGWKRSSESERRGGSALERRRRVLEEVQAYLLYFTRFTGTEVHTDAEGALWTFAHADASGSKARARGAAMRACAVAKTGPTRPQRM